MEIAASPSKLPTTIHIEPEYLTSNKFCQLPLIDFELVTQLYPPNDFQMFVAMGYKKMRNRLMQFNKAKQKGYRLINFISQKSYIRENIQLGENNVIMSSCDIEPCVSIGNNILHAVTDADFLNS